jgi:tRNA-dihydrouridine synthase
MSFWNEIPKPIVGLSPMDGVTDASFRFIAATVGRPDVILTEFVSVDAAAFAPYSLLRDFAYTEVERPIVAQIYGHIPEAFYKVAHIVGALGFDGLDINMGCPAKKVAAKGCGAGLILTPALARAIVRAARRGIQDWADGQNLADIGVGGELIADIESANRLRTGAAAVVRRAIPISIKTRIGYEEIVVEEWIGNLLEESPAAISIHGRTLKQQYSGSADWDAIARAVEVARGSATLILGNGDLRGLNDVYRRVTETGVDGVLLGRVTQGNPWIFQGKNELKEALSAGRPLSAAPPPPSIDAAERFRVLLAHSRHFAALRERHAFVAMRKQLAWYIRAMPRAADMRYRMVHVNDLDDVVRCLADYAAAVEVESFPLRDACEPRAALSL